MATEFVTFQRDCDVVQIPAGNTITLPRGTGGVVTQSLGGTFTLQIPSSGQLVRVQGTDADAIGKTPPPTAEAPAESGGSLEERVWQALRACFDPEIPVNIVDLGLVYDMRVSPEGDGHRVDVKMTLTAQGCGMGGAIAGDARQKLLDLEGVADAEVEIVWDPPWNPRMISPEGREILGID